MNFGYRPEPATPADLNFTSDLLPKLAAPIGGDVDLSAFCTMSNQYSLSACAGNATADAIEILNDIREKALAKAQGRAPKPPTQVSRLFIYSMARGIMDDDGDGYTDLNRDEGVYIRLCFDVLSRFGVCDETIWPYLESKVFTQPSIKALRQAVGHRIHSYYRISETGQSRIDAIVSALRSQHPVVFGTMVDKAFLSEKDSGPIHTPKDELIGGHAMIIVGYVAGNFLVKNSWGKNWRRGGFAEFTPEYLTWSRTTELWVPTLGTNF